MTLEQVCEWLGRKNEDVVFLTKGQPPFIVNPEGEPMAMVILDKKTNGIICMKCKKSFASVGPHVKVHGMSARQYRNFFGLPQRIPLANPDIIETHRANMLSQIEEGLISPNYYTKETVPKFNRKGIEKPLLSRYNTNTCKDTAKGIIPQHGQLKSRLIAAMDKYGPQLTLSQLKEFEGHDGLRQSIQWLGLKFNDVKVAWGGLANPAYAPYKTSEERSRNGYKAWKTRRLFSAKNLIYEGNL